MYIKINKKLLFIPVILWMAVIFMFSSQPVDKSTEISESITDKVIEAVDKVTPSNIDFKQLEHYIRKLGHLSEYFVLGFLLYFAFRHNRVFKKHIFLWCLLICVVYAASDEFHQAFVPGRGPGVIDVLIDSTGASIGILFSRCIFKK